MVLRFRQAFDLDPAVLNVNGGAIAFGHPIGATGGMLVGTVVDELERTGKGIALVTLCIGAGMGTAAVIELDVVAAARSDQGHPPPQRI